MPSVAALAPPASPAAGPLAALSVARLVGNTPLKAGDELSIVPAIAGGR